jgi:hypothetical protein
VPGRERPLPDARARGVRWVIRRITAVGALVACLLLGLLSLTAPAAWAGDATSSTTVTSAVIERDLPRTALEADERENKSTPQAPYVIWSTVAAAAMVGGGGLWLRRRQQREEQG